MVFLVRLIINQKKNKEKLDDVRIKKEGKIKNIYHEIRF